LSKNVELIFKSEFRVLLYLMFNMPQKRTYKKNISANQLMTSISSGKTQFITTNFRINFF